MSGQYNRGVHYFALLTAVLTLALITLGAYISSSGYGLAIADWPTSMGKLIPDNLAGGIFYEFWHRMLSALVGAMTILLGVYLFTRDTRAEVQKLGLAAAALIVLQIVVGGIGVLYLFPSLVKTLHAGFAHVFFAVAIGLVAYNAPAEGRSLEFDPKTVRRTRALAYMVLVQVLVGAVVRHAEVSAVYLPSLLFHVVLALGVVIAGVTTGLGVLREGRGLALKAAGGLTLILVVVQLLVGIGVLVTAPPLDQLVGQPPKGYVGQSVLHVAGGALLLGLSVYMALMARRGKAA